MWKATVQLFTSYPNQKGGWSFGDREVSAVGRTQRDAKERLGDTLVRAIKGDNRWMFDWPEGTVVDSIDLMTIKLERISEEMA